MPLLTEEQVDLLIENGKKYAAEEDLSQAIRDLPAAVVLRLPGTGLSWVLSFWRSDLGLAIGATCTAHGGPQIGLIDLADLEAMRFREGHAVEADRSFSPNVLLHDHLGAVTLLSRMRLQSRVFQRARRSR